MSCIPTNWIEKAIKFPFVSFLNSNAKFFENIVLPKEYISFDWILAVGTKDCELATIYDLKNGEGKNNWWFGHLSYELKNELFQIDTSKNQDYSIPNSMFFKPNFLAISIHGKIEIITNDIDFENSEKSINFLNHQKNQKVTFSPQFTKDQYLHNIAEIKKAIKKGDYYEINYCINWVAALNNLDSIAFLEKMFNAIPAPFSAFYKFNSIEVFSASPERFLKHTNNKLLSQPIKGTRKRGKNQTEDEENIQELISNEKELAENVMIVDLVRNDLSIFGKPGTTTVSELQKVFTFPQVHQMVSSVETELPIDSNPLEALLAAFPMGSMTGAPKKKVIESIENLESFQRGIYSGSIGYIAPNGNYDFNVVIRSLVYDRNNCKIWNSAGSAITWDSIPEEEFQECLIKAKALQDLF